MAFRISQGIIQFYDSGTSSYKGKYKFDTRGKLVETNDAGTRIADVSDTTPLSVTKNGSNIFAIDLRLGTNFLLNASGTWAMTVSVTTDVVGKSGMIIIKNSATTSPGA